MNRKEILDALNEISDAHITEAARPPKRKSVQFYWYGGVAAVLAVAILLGVFLRPQTPPSHMQNPTFFTTVPTVPTFIPAGPKLVTLSGQTLAKAEYPEKAADDTDISIPLAELKDYFSKTMEQFLQGEENTAFSPINLYMSLAMLAETTDGETRAEILNLLDAGDMDRLRAQANLLWNSSYQIGKQPCVLANSVWLQEGVTYNKDTMELLAENYYASAYGNDFTAPNAAEPIARWINKETGDFLKEQTGALKFSPLTKMALVSTVYLKTDWAEAFDPEKNTQGVFYGTNGETTCTYMNGATHILGAELQNYYEGADYQAVPTSLYGGYTMWLILPKEGKTTDDLVKSGEYTQLLTKDRPEGIRVDVNLTMPKFDITCKQKLITGLKQLGVTSAFESGTADFTPAFPGTDGLYVGDAEQATRVTVTETGVTAASYVEIDVTLRGGAFSKIDFVLDRPFLFVITTTDNVPLFAGCVNNP